MESIRQRLCGRRRPLEDSETSEPKRQRLEGEEPSAGEAVDRIDRRQFVVDNPGKLDDFYEVERKELGVGGFGSVFKARSKVARGEAWRAVKSMAKPRVKDLQQLNAEISLMKEMDHPHIVKLYETFQDNQRIYLVMELCTGGELFDRIIAVQHFSELHAAVLMQQILRAVYYMHSQQVIHRDLKPENFLLVNSDPIENNTLKVIDFGLACKVRPDEVLALKAGSPFYMAPEVIAGSYNVAADLWSTGVVLYILLCGAPPFNGKDHELHRMIRNATVSFSGDVWPHISEDAKQLVLALLSKDARKRPTAQQALDHIWISQRAPKASGEPLPRSIVDNLCAFQSHNWFKRAALQVMARQLAEPEIKALRTAFLALDANGDGKLTMAEIKEGLKQHAGLENINLDSMDVDKSGEVDYSEFIAAVLDRRSHLEEDKCWAAFRTFDKDGNGKISKAELSEVLNIGNLEESAKAERIAEVMKDIDRDGDGEIDFEEFMLMMKGSSN